MTSLKFSGTKRKTSEAPVNNSFVSQTSAARSSRSAKPGACNAAAPGSGGSSSGVDEDEEESSSSSSSSSLGHESSRVKRFKHTLANIRENASEESNTDLSEDSSKDPAKPKEYGRVNDLQLSEAIKIAEEKQGECISKITISSDGALAFKCKFGHIFKASLIDASTKWCPTCQKYFVQCQQFASMNNGQLVDAILTTPVRFKCSRGHEFTCKTYRAKHLKWCTICKEIDEANRKKEAEEKAAQETASREQEQEKLFEEARKAMEQEAMLRAYQESIRYETFLEQNICQKSKYEASIGKIGEINCYWVNKILMTPDEMLMRNLYF